MVLLAGIACTKKSDFTTLGSTSFNYLRAGGVTAIGVPGYNDRATVVINESADIDEWLKKEINSETSQRNSELKYAKRGTLYYLDLNFVNNDYSSEAKAAWLQENEARINYEETSKFVSFAHVISHPEEVHMLYTLSTATAPTKPGDFKVAQLSAIKTLINDKLGPNAFENSNYAKYIEFDLGGTALAVKDHVKFTGSSHMFSLPMLRSIVKAHGLLGTDEIGIGKLTHNSGTFDAIWVQKDNTFYDYSNEPR